MKKNVKKTLVMSTILLFIISSSFHVFGSSISSGDSEIKEITIEITFSDPEVVAYEDYYVVRVKETNHNRMYPGRPILPVNISCFKLPFGSKIEEVHYIHSKPEIINLPGNIAFASYPQPDNMINNPVETEMDLDIYDSSDPYPSDWISHHTGGGLSFGDHTTFLVVRAYPVRYFPSENQLEFIHYISITISYTEPEEPILEDNDIYDLLIIAPRSFKKELRPLVFHKEKYGFKTKLVSLNEIYDHMYFQGQDRQEKIKYFIKTAVEEWGVEYVLLVGGIHGQTFFWNLPVRYSHVVPPSEQEYPEPSFITDLYYADIYDGEGKFTSWDSNNNDIFAEWNDDGIDEMDLYPDVYLGRIPCRNLREVRIMCNKIINYEKNKADNSWFKNYVIVAGDSYNDTYKFNEGELIGEKSIELMPDFNPVKVYARLDENMDINKQTVNKAMNPGSGFAYFCGHGNPISWSTHYPPEADEWTTGYKNDDMISLINGFKLPVVVVGGCHNGQFDVTMWKILQGFREDRFQFFSLKKGNIGGFWSYEWVPNCWAWMLTSKQGGGAIATIANTGLGTHGDGDTDNNSVADYLEILDGWLELRFLELYGLYGYDILGENHGETMTGYISKFLDDGWRMDPKMVQQWELFGDPSLKIGGYE